MNNKKVFSVFAIIFAIAIAPASGAFAQSDIAPENTDVPVDKEQKKQYIAELKEKKQSLRDMIRDYNSNKVDRLHDRLSDRIADVEPTLSYKGTVSGWAVIGGQAYDTDLALDGTAGQLDNGKWYLTGIGTVSVGDRVIPFDIKGFAKGNHIGLKGVSQDNESVVIHLRGNFAPIAESDNSFALSFKHGAVSVKDTDVRVPLALVGQVQVESLTDDTEPIIPEFDSTEAEAVLELLI